MNASLIWEKLLVDGKKIASTEDISAIAREIKKNEKRSLYYLQEEGYIVRVLRGIFYIRSLAERARRGQDCSIYEMVAMALKEKGVKNWYFALETALKMNLMTHEHFFIDYVITDSYRTTKVISIVGHNFRFIRRGSKFFKCGIVRNKRIYYSDRGRTLLDIAYRGFLKSQKPNTYLGVMREYQDIIVQDNVRKHLSIFPRQFIEEVETLL